ncbi:CRAL-TRIO domain and GOLD domain and CRAL/TRIO,N-terminal domain-containing protein [Strongyloides ratti]|uniref:CRAL-TRIO domain and GOLD domain and CRAL/TRIO,N-terminal domain-containing protein n=1 Tax=Strongyloides ratti TaxID=34506 RepID=A0A090KYH3_STRRB|nr:CRAL-TRIO domain and GOLD domain and CRAL/TRIO,N-terminal domain-containing protein [Strongyloides ratti]CEF60932.1 CRAL-TRIO domain and GOLD domain and CRAL/TRIO,N-terminal domain-containing protein [Strongyloides ratti]
MVQNNISQNDQIKINELRKLVENELTPYYDTDFNLLRWLQGHDYKLDIIVPKLKNHLLFRKSKWDLDNLAKENRNFPVHEYWPAGYTGPAIKIPNVIVNVEQTGVNDFWGLLHTYPLNDILKARCHDLETMLKLVMEEEKKSGEKTSILYILDLSNLNFDLKLTTLMTGALSSISSFMADHYVELIHSFVLVGCPTFITTLWNIAKPLLPEKTKNKVKILGSHTWKDEILTMACPESLPTFWNCDNNQLFLADVKRPKNVDEKDYYKGSLQPADKVQLFSVSAETDGHFAYAIYCTENDNENDSEKMITAYPRFNKVPGPTWVPLTDEIIAPITGTYHFWFSNEHAWIHNLKIKYIIELKD